MSDHTPSIDTARECFVDGAAGEFIAEDFDRMIESVRAEARRLPVPSDGCVCTGYMQDAGGGYSEIVPEYEPACPEHSEHVWDPRQGMWVSRAEERERIARNIVRELGDGRAADIVREGT